MNATIGLLAYGLRPSPLADEAPVWLLASGAYSSFSWELQMQRAHAGCHVSAFCRNPLHPGPCKGWKHHLGLVSPGALHALEKVRHEQLEKKRLAKVQALKDAGKAVPKHLAAPIVYDPAKNKYLNSPEHGKVTPGLGVPTKGLTPEAAKATLEKIPTKVQVGAKLDAKHAAEAKTLGDVKAIISGKHDGAPLSSVVGAFMKLSKGQYDGLTQDEKKKVVQRIALHHSSMVKHAGKPAMAGLPAGAADDLAKKYEELTGKPISDHAEVWKSLATPEELAHVVEAAAAVPKPTEKPTHMTIAKAGLKPGDKVFLHGKGKTPGEGQLVTVRKIPGDGKAQGYEFEDAKGEMLPHAGGPAAKWHLSPAPGQSFPETKAKVAPSEAKPEAVQVGKDQVAAKSLVDKLTAGSSLTDAKKAQNEKLIMGNATSATPKKLFTPLTADHLAHQIVNDKLAIHTQAHEHVQPDDVAEALKAELEHVGKHGGDTPVLKAVDEAVAAGPNAGPEPGQKLAAAVSAALGKKVEPLKGFEKGEKTKMDNLAKVAANQDKHNAQAATMGKVANQAFGKTVTDVHMTALVNHAASADAKGEPPVDEAWIDNASKKISGKLWTQKAEIQEKMHQGDLEAALKKDVEDGVLHGKPTPVLDAAKEAGVMLGQGKPGAVDALAEAVHKKLGISGKDEMPAGPKIKTEVMHEVPSAAQADAFHEPAAFGAPNVGASAEAKEAIAYANGHKSGTDSKKLEAYQKLSPGELAALDPNTQKLMAANLAGMQKKFLKPDKKAAAGAMLAKVQKAQGGGAGAGGSSAVGTPAVAALDHEAKGAQGAANAFKHGLIKTGPGSPGYEAMQQTFTGMHASPDQAAVEQAFHQAGATAATGLLKNADVSQETPLGSAVHPALAKELAEAFKGGTAPTPLADALHSSSPSDHGPIINAAMEHPAIGSAAFLGGDTKAHIDAQAAKMHELQGDLGIKVPLSVAKQYLHNAHSNGELDKAIDSVAGEMASAHADDIVHMLGLDGTQLAADLTTPGTGIVQSVQQALHADYAKALKTASDPSGLAKSLYHELAVINFKADEISAKNGWPKDGPTLQAWKAAYAKHHLAFLVQKHQGAPSAGAGGVAAHVPPAAHVATPAVPHVAPVGKPSSPGGVIQLKHKQALKVVSQMKSFPEGQYLESPEPKIWDNLVAISAHENITPMQALSTLDEQNAKKLSVTNANLLEKKVRAWLSTADGKAYADANKTPKPHLVDHLNSYDSAHTDFTNKTGIPLPPGEKVQQPGGPGAFNESTPDTAFGKYSTAQAEADQNALKAKLGVKFTPQQLGALKEYVSGSHNINTWLRDEHTPSQHSIDNAIYLQSMMLPTPKDHLLLRGTGWEQFPPEARSYEGLKALVGETLEEPAFLSASVSGSSSGFGGAVKMHIQAPKGTMGVFTKDDQYTSQYLGTEAELLLAAKTQLKVMKVWKEGGQVQVLMRVVSD